MSENYGFAVSMTGDAISQLEKLSHKLVEAHEKGEGLSSVFKSMLGANLAMSGISAAANLLKEGFNKTIESSGELADKFTVAMGGASNALGVFLNGITTGDFDNLTKAFEAGEKYAEKMIEYKDKMQGLNVTKSVESADIQQATVDMRDHLKSWDERISRGKTAIDLQKKLAQSEKDIADEALKSGMTLMRSKSELSNYTEKDLKDYYKNISTNPVASEQAFNYKKTKDELTHLENAIKGDVTGKYATKEVDAKLATLKRNIDAIKNTVSGKTGEMLYDIKRAFPGGNEGFDKLAEQFTTAGYAAAKFNQETKRLQSGLSTLEAEKNKQIAENKLKDFDIQIAKLGNMEISGRKDINKELLKLKIEHNKEIAKLNFEEKDNKEGLAKDLELADLKYKNQIEALKQSALNISALSGARGGLGEAKIVNINMEAAQKVTINGAGSDGVSKYKSASDQAVDQIIREINNLTGGNAGATI